MKQDKSMRLFASAILLTLLLAACSSGGGGGANAAPPGSTSTNNVPRFVYVANVSDNTLSIYSVDAGRTLRHNGYASTGIAPRAVVSDPQNKFLYVANSGAGSISAFAVDGVNGQLTQIDADALTAGVQDFAAGTSPIALAMHLSGKFLYAANNGSNTITAYTVDPATGALSAIDADTVTAGVQYFAATAPVALAINPSGSYLYVLDNAVSSISAFSIDPSTGRLTSIDADAVSAGSQALHIAGANPTNIAMDPLGGYLYAMDSNPATGQLHALKIDAVNGALTLSKSQLLISGPTAAAIHPSGRFAFVANFSGPNDTASSGVNAFTIDRSDGTLTAINTVITTPKHASGSVSLDPTGNVACFAVSQEEISFTNYGPSNYLDCFFVDQSTGALSAAGTLRTRTPPTGIAWISGSSAVSYKAKNVYTANMSAGTISQFSVAIDGGLAPLSAPTVTSKEPRGLAVDGSGRYLYAGDFTIGGNALSQFSIEPDGSLVSMPVATVKAGVDPLSIASDPAGRYVYATGLSSSVLSQYTIQPGGQLQAMSPPTITTGTSPYAVVVDPSGKFVYTANYASNDLSQYTIGPTGLLTAMTPATVAAGANPSSIAIDPSGQYAYVANFGSNTVSQFTMNYDGSLVSMATASVATDIGPVCVVVHPQGLYVYVANLYGASISQYKINADGSLVSLSTPTVATGIGAYSLNIDPSGRYAYVASNGEDKVYQYDIGANGVLSPMTSPTISTGQGPISLTVTRTIE